MSALRRTSTGGREADLMQNWSSIKEQQKVAAEAAAKAGIEEVNNSGFEEQKKDGPKTKREKIKAKAKKKITGVEEDTGPVISLAARGYRRNEERDPQWLRDGNFCVVLIFGEKTYTPEYMAEVKEKLKNHGLVVAERESSYPNQKNFLIGMDDKNTEIMAEQLEFPLRIEPTKGDPLKVRYEPFTKARSKDFQKSPEYMGSKKFLPSQRVRLVISVMKTALGVDYYDKKRFKKIFPLHDADQKKHISRMFFKCCSKYPLNDIRAYYGERIALYFTFLDFYTKFLTISAILGLAFQVLSTFDSVMDLLESYAVGPGVIPDLDYILEPTYTFFLSVWGTLFLVYWRRHRSVCTFTWNTFQMTSTREMRPEFYGRYKKDEITGQTMLDFSVKQRCLQKYSISLTIAFTMIIGVAAFITGILIFKAWAPFPYAAMLAGFSNGIIIFITNRIYRTVSIKFTDFENHKSENAWENSFIIKTFMFQFVNSYTQLYYLAFFKGRLAKYGLPDQPCHDPDNCYPEVEKQLFSQFLGQLFFGQCIEVLMPYLKFRINNFLTKRRAAKIDRVQAVDKEDLAIETEGAMEDYDIFDDYGELVIQFGYVTLFASALPLAPFLAWANNLVEVRSDYWKMANFCRRPVPQQQSVIGRWYSMLVFLSFMSVVTNLGMLAVTSKMMHNFVRTNPLPESWGMGPISSKFFYFFVMEHLFMGMKIVLSMMIPDVHPWVTEQLFVVEREKKDKTSKQIQERIKVGDGGETDGLLKKMGVDVGAMLEKEKAATVAEPPNPPGKQKKK